MPDLLYALTLHQPWAHWMANGTKPIENRSWPPPPWLIGKPLCLHAGKTYDEEGDAWIKSHFPALKWPVVDHRVKGQIVAVGELVGVMAKHERLHEHPGISTPKDLIAKGLVRPDDLHWFFGEYGWVLRNVVQLPRPVVCRGFQKVWNVPSELVPLVTSQFEAGKAKAATRA